MTKAVCPGSFDPVTLGHIDIINRANQMFDEVTVLVTGNPDKPSGLFCSGLLVDYTTDHGVDVLVKGLRSSLDYEYELPMAQMNRRLSGIDTVFLLTDEKYGYISSSLCKQVAKFGGDVTGMFPDAVGRAVKEKYRE